MMPQQLVTTVADGDPVSSRILVVVDESDHPVRALRYVEPYCVIRAMCMSRAFIY
jgi:hypothetical protein